MKPTISLLALLILVNAGIAQTVSIGKQIWQAQNLDVSAFRNGDPIPHAKTDEEWKRASENKQPAWCYYNNDPANGTKYGKLYNWYAVNDPRGLAPAGYHIPTSSEWDVLMEYLGGRDVAGGKMKTANGWGSSITGESNVPTQTNSTGSNSSRFSGLPGGYRYHSGSLEYIGSYGYWWSATEYDADFARDCFLYYKDDGFYRDFTRKGCGLSIRCVRD